MKKIFVLFLALAIVAPAIGLICDCCPAKETPASGTSIESGSHDCCWVMKFDRETSRLESLSALISPISQRLMFREVSTRHSLKTVPPPSLSFLDGLGPPVLPNTPLYLAENVLRL